MENENSKKKQLIGLVIFVVVFLAIKYLLPSLWQLVIAHQFAVVTGAVFLVAGIVAVSCWSSMPRTAIICGALSLFSLLLVTMNLFHEAGKNDSDRAKDVHAEAKSSSLSPQMARASELLGLANRAYGSIARIDPDGYRLVQGDAAACAQRVNDALQANLNSQAQFEVSRCVEQAITACGFHSTNACTALKEKY